MIAFVCTFGVWFARPVSLGVEIGVEWGGNARSTIVFTILTSSSQLRATWESSSTPISMRQSKRYHYTSDGLWWQHRGRRECKPR